MEERDNAEFARELREKIKEQGTGALERTEWAEQFKAYGFEMDCGASLDQHYGLALGDVRGIVNECKRIDNVQTLGNAVFSQCRYITHWAMGPCDERVEWLTIALTRLEEIA